MRLPSGPLLPVEMLRQDRSSASLKLKQLSRVGRRNEPLLADAEEMKQRVRDAILRPPRTEADFYRVGSIWTSIACARQFEWSTLFVITFNALWLMIDSQYNLELVSINQHWVFQTADHFFCSYYVFEWIVRFMALKRKLDGLRDKFFVLDTFLVVSVVLDTWIFLFFFAVTDNMHDNSSASAGAPLFKMFRLVRLLRLARIVRLVRTIPELMILIRGIAVAARSVFVTLLLMFVIIYGFTIACMQLTKNSDMRQTHFPSVGQTMMNLLLRGVLPDQRELVEDLSAEDPLLGALALLFILVASLTVMNMLIGILVEVVSAVSSVDKEQGTIQHAKDQMLEAFQSLDMNSDNEISVQEFRLMLANSRAILALQNIGVDVVGLVDMTDCIFKDRASLPIPQFMEIVLELRGSNFAKVKDVVDLRKFFLDAMDSLAEEFYSMTMAMRAHDAADRRACLDGPTARDPSGTSVDEQIVQTVS